MQLFEQLGFKYLYMQCSFIKKSISLLAFILLLDSCCPKDPTSWGATAPCPEYFWKGTNDVICPCDNDIVADDVLKTSEESMQRDDVEVVDLINTALLNNPTTQITWANARAAAFGVEIAKSALYPTVVLNEELNYNYTEFDDGFPNVTPAAAAAAATTIPDTNLAKRQQTTTTPGTTANSFGSLGLSQGSQTNLISDISISYLLLDFGGRRANIEAAKQALYSSNWIHNRQVQQVLINVLQAYYNYSGIDALLVARYDDLKNSQANYDAALHQFEAGVKNKLDVLQAKTNLINIELSIVQLQGQKKVAYGALANALGFPSNAVFTVPTLVEEVGTDVIKENIDELVKLAWNRRPDLAAAFARHDEAKEQVIIARSAGMPTLSTFWNFEEFNSFNNPSFNNHSVAGSLVITAPIFSGFIYMNQERQAKEFVRAACGTIRDIELNISQDVIASYFNFKTAVKSLKFAKENLANSEEAYKAAYETYKEGISTILDLLLAQQNLSESRAQVIQARTAWAIALSNISFAVGIIGTQEEIKPWEIKK
jgi:outer membrane protein